jgi:multiple sugar transport system permease protein
LGVSLLFGGLILLMALGSLREPGLAPPRGIEIVPSDPSVQSYRAAFDTVELARGLRNSLLVAGMVVPLSILVASWAGFAIANLRARQRRLAVAALLALLAVPISTLWLSRFAVFNWLGLRDTFVPLVAPALLGGSPVLVLLYLLAFRRLPRDLLDAARLEGASHLRVWGTVAMPLVRGTTVGVGLLAFALTWGSFIDPLLYLSSPERYTAPLVLRELQQVGQTNWPVMMAAATVVTAPVVIAFAAALRLIIPRRGHEWAS